MSSVLFILVGVLIGTLVGYMLSRISLSRSMEKERIEMAELSTSKRYYQSQVEELKQQVARGETASQLIIGEKDREIKSLLQENAHLGSEIEQLKGWRIKFDQEMQKKELLMQQNFEILSQRIFEEKTQRMSEINNKEIHALLTPIRENIHAFKKQVEETYDKESKQRFSLEQRIADLVSINNQISEDAKNLTKALQGNSKVQGDWGEMILESILERSGLQKNREYFIQSTLKDSQGKAIIGMNGQMMRPDVMIVYPDNRCIIVDSKVSLSAYAKYMDDQGAPSKRKEFLNEHIMSIKKHVNELAAKSYQDYTDSLDFVMMFVPNEPAYSLAIQESPDLWQYAYQRRVLIISPTNLITALKLVADLWKREKQNRNALDIAERGGRLYDKFVTLLATLDEVGVALRRAQKSYDEAMGQVSHGSGNLISQVEKLKSLGAKAKKQLPSNE